MTISDQLQGYIEADVAGTLTFPGSVRLIIGSFGELFGSEDGERLQSWCRTNQWPLVWALGAQNGASFRGLDRVFDVPTLVCRRLF